MATVKNLTQIVKERYLVKHSATVHISNTLSLIERKVFNCLMMNAVVNGKSDDKYYHISLLDLKRVLDYRRNDYDELKAAIDTLLTTKLQWNVLGKDQKGKCAWDNATTFISSRSLSVTSGVLRYSLSPELQDLLLQPNIYAKLNLLIQNQFKSKHSLVLWEFLVEHLCSSAKHSKTTWINVGDYKTLLGVTPEEYKKFKEISRLLVKKPLQEINTVSDVVATEEYKREGKKVVALRFDVRKQNCQLTLFNCQEYENKKNIPYSYTFIKTSLADKTFNLSDKQVDSLIEYFEWQKSKDKKLTIENFEEAIESVRENILNNKNEVINAIAQLKTAIKENWQPKLSKEKRKIIAKKEQLSTLEGNLSTLLIKRKKLEDEFHKYIYNVAKKQFSASSEDEKDKRLGQNSTELKKDTSNEGTINEGFSSIGDLSKKYVGVMAEKQAIQEFVDDNIMKNEKVRQSLLKSFQKQKGFSVKKLDDEIKSLSAEVKKTKNI